MPKAEALKHELAIFHYELDAYDDEGYYERKLCEEDSKVLLPLPFFEQAGEERSRCLIHRLCANLNTYYWALEQVHGDPKENAEEFADKARRYFYEWQRGSTLQLTPEHEHQILQIIASYRHPGSTHKICKPGHCPVPCPKLRKRPNTTPLKRSRPKKVKTDRKQRSNSIRSGMIEDLERENVPVGCFQKFKSKTPFTWHMGPEMCHFLEWAKQCPYCKTEFPGIMFSNNKNPPVANEFCLYCRACDDLTKEIWNEYDIDLIVLHKDKEAPPINRDILGLFLKNWFRQWQIKIKRLQSDAPQELKDCWGQFVDVIVRETYQDSTRGNTPTGIEPFQFGNDSQRPIERENDDAPCSVGMGDAANGCTPSFSKMTLRSASYRIAERNETYANTEAGNAVSTGAEVSSNSLNNESLTEDQTQSIAQEVLKDSVQRTCAPRDQSEGSSSEISTILTSSRIEPSTPITPAHMTEVSDKPIFEAFVEGSGSQDLEENSSRSHKSCNSAEHNTHPQPWTPQIREASAETASSANDSDTSSDISGRLSDTSSTAVGFTFKGDALHDVTHDSTDNCAAEWVQQSVEVAASNNLGTCLDMSAAVNEMPPPPLIPTNPTNQASPSRASTLALSTICPDKVNGFLAEIAAREDDAEAMAAHYEATNAYNKACRRLIHELGEKKATQVARTIIPFGIDDLATDEVERATKIIMDALDFQRPKPQSFRRSFQAYRPRVEESPDP